MAGIDKTISKMKSQPNGIGFEDISKVLEHYGYEFIRQSSRIINHSLPICMENKDKNYYLGLPYNITVQKIHEESGDYYYARVLELDGCQSHGATVEEAYANIYEAMEGWIEIKMEFGDAIPEPISDNDYSGKFNIRIPKSLHRRLAVEAESEGVSMNQYALYKLAL